MIDTPNEENVYGIIVKNIAEALLTPLDRIIPSARLLTDLNAESIDIADIRFRLEHDLNLKIDQKGMIESLGTNLSAEEFNNRFTVQFIWEHVMRRLAEQGRTTWSGRPASKG
jgi:acyl carrier protein